MQEEILYQKNQRSSLWWYLGHGFSRPQHLWANKYQRTQIPFTTKKTFAKY